MTHKQRALFCTVLAPLLACGQLGCARAEPEVPLEIGQPVITVTAAYPGASAEVVADTVAGPVEQQVQGVKQSLHLLSRCASDGSYTLRITFAAGADLKVAQVQVQKRVKHAMQVLPELVKHGGVRVKISRPSLPLILTLSSPNGRYDTLYLSDYVTSQLRDELARVEGVGAILGIGQRDHELRLWLDADKLAAFNMTGKDVIDCLESQNVKVGKGQIGQLPVRTGAGFEYTITNLGRLIEIEQLENVPLKAAGKGQRVRLRDVARIERISQEPPSHVRLNGMPVVALCLEPIKEVQPGDWSATVRKKLMELRARLPEDLHLDVAFDFTPKLQAPARPIPSDSLVLDLDLPDTAVTLRTLQVLDHCQAALRKPQGVQEVLALCGPPFAPLRNQACLVVRLAPAAKRQANHEQVKQAIRAQLKKQIPEAVLRLRDLSEPGRLPLGDYPVDLAVSGPEGPTVRAFGEKLAQRLHQSKKLTDVWASRDAVPQPQLIVATDREKAKQVGVSMEDVLATLQAMGETSQRFKGDLLFRGSVADFRRLRVRSAQGQMILLTNLAKIRALAVPEFLDRLDGQPMVAITANLAAGVSLGQVRQLCETLATEVRQELRLPAAYRLTWLHKMPAPL